ncbi:MAG: stage II sporulation protein M [Anaerolineales bacterium]|jgi:uncharacterized membrane protein SpoIIM required for sporulation/ABC-type transport system involved in multi-copper enzyme maturation permease subunit
MTEIQGRSLGLLSGTLLVAKREIRDQLRDWRIVVPIVLLTVFFPALMNFTARSATDFVARYGAEIVGERLIPFLLMVVGFFPISISLVIALESFAGERERLSLEPLLASPLDDRQLYFGKTLASLAVPLAAAYLGILVYLLGLKLRLGWSPPGELLLQVLIMTTVQAALMVTGAVVISAQATSVRAANLLASFIIIPVSQLIIGESMIMFWGRYEVLWLVVIGLTMLTIVLGRMGVRLFNREELLGRQMDRIDLRWAWRSFWGAFRGKARNLRAWYREVLSVSLAASWPGMLVMVVSQVAAFLVGMALAEKFTIPAESLTFDSVWQGLQSDLVQYGFFSGKGLLWVLKTNLTALTLAAILGLFSFGTIAVVLLMVPIGIIGYFAGNMMLAGQDAAGLLLVLVVPHGILEIPASIISGAAILQMGMATLLLPKGKTLGGNWLQAMAEWARITLGVVLPLLIAAALLEVFLTPRVALWALGQP